MEVFGASKLITQKFKLMFHFILIFNCNQNHNIGVSQTILHIPLLKQWSPNGRRGPFPDYRINFYRLQRSVNCIYILKLHKAKMAENGQGLTHKYVHTSLFVNTKTK